MQDRTVIAINHCLSTVKKADVIYMLEDGKVVESGSYASLIAQKGRFYAPFEAHM